jgi:hypothetical protein
MHNGGGALDHRGWPIVNNLRDNYREREPLTLTKPALHNGRGTICVRIVASLICGVVRVLGSFEVEAVA